ncbi:LPS translocon maturation chaperone LptM [Chromobacterium vaccinii]|uniref:LPS translocon maturation chaperone LptM n=1 Tax=Chromobacterium vaccinii TaxID=1108595 RepID=UPI000B11A02D|nr:lipoprotein [Chromobacterium vaccinii]SUX29427.1 Predicted small periplasmic lipoprotein [Chromobacterium vaccinii]
MRTLLACASLTLILAACGYKGPLVLPQQPKKAPSAAHAVKPDASAPKADASASR